MFCKSKHFNAFLFVRIVCFSVFLSIKCGSVEGGMSWYDKSNLCKHMCIQCLIWNTVWNVVDHFLPEVYVWARAGHNWASYFSCRLPGLGWRWMFTPRLCPSTTSVDMTCWRGSTTLCTSPTLRLSSSVQVRSEVRRISTHTAGQDNGNRGCRVLVFRRSGVLPVHGHVVSRLYPSEEGQIPSQAGARIDTQLQSSPGSF